MKTYSRVIMLCIQVVGIAASTAMGFALLSKRDAGDIVKLNLIELLDWPLLFNSFVCSVLFGSVIGELVFTEYKQPLMRKLLWVVQTIWMSFSAWLLYQFFTF